MSTEVTMTYGGESIIPVPLVSIQRDSLQTGNRTDPIGYTFRMTLNGTLIPCPAPGGLIVLDGLIEELRTIFNRDGKQLLIECDNIIVMSLYPRIKSVNFGESDNKWVNTVPYTIELEYDTDELNEHPMSDIEVPPYIESYNEEWQCEFIQDRKHFVWDLSQVVDQQGGYDYATADMNNPWEARVTHNVSVKGKQSWAGPGPTGTPTNAVDNAMAWLTGVFNDFGYDNTYGHSLAGWNNLIGHGSDGNFDHYRSHSINETDGTVSLTENWMILGANTGLLAAQRRITEDFSVEIRESVDNGLANISINGTIQGLEEMDYSTPLSETYVVTSAYTHASGAWSAIQDRILPRAQLIYEQDFNRSVNPQYLTRSVGHNPSKGTISYAYEFNDRPCAFITGALSENFTIVDNNPSDVFAKLTVLGRGAGPVLQAISTVTEATREITIEAVMSPPTGCTSISDLDLNKPSVNVKNILCEFQTNLTNAYAQVFKNSDVENWNPLSGRYSRTVSFTYASCSGDIDTSMCG